MCAFWNMIVRSGVFIKSLMNIRTIKVNIRWYKEVISLRGDFFVCKSRKSLNYRGFGFFSFCEAFYVVPENLLVIACCYALAFKGYCFETSSYLGGFTQNIKSCTGSRLYSWRRMEHKINLKRHTAEKPCVLWLTFLNKTLDDGCDAI